MSADLDNISPITITVEQARKLSGLGTTTIFKLLRKGILKRVKVGRKTLIWFDSLQALLQPAGDGDA